MLVTLRGYGVKQAKFENGIVHSLPSWFYCCHQERFSKVLSKLNL